MRLLALLAVLALVFSATALPASARGPAKPRWFAVPPAWYQRDQAQVFDPYPQTDTGPFLDGGRPLGYLHPPSEATRGRWPRPGTYPKPHPVPANAR